MPINKMHSSNQIVNSNQNFGLIAWLVLLILVIWFTYPVFFVVPVEGYIANIINIGEGLAKGSIYNTDLIQPFNIEYFALTKFGVVLEIAILVKFFGLSGYNAFVIISLIGELLLISSTTFLIKKWAKTTWFVAIFVSILVPSLTENGYFLNDNVIGAGLVTFSFVLFYNKNPIISILGGILFGLGVLNRVDLVLLAPSIILIFWERGKFDKYNIITMFIAGILALATWQIPLLLVHKNILDTLKVGNEMVGLWNREPAIIRQLIEILIANSFVGLVLLLIGIANLIKNKNYYLLFFLIMPIIVFNLIFFGKVWQSRQILGLAPFFATLVAIGTISLKDAIYESKDRSTLYGIVFIFILITILPFNTQSSDGPRHLLGGRLWAPISWRNWQNQWNSDFDKINSIILQNNENSKIIISDYWDEDRYIHMAIENSGFHIDKSQTLSQCPKIGEIFTNGKNKIIHIRLHETIAMAGDYFQAIMFKKYAIACIKQSEIDNIIFVSKHNEKYQILPENKIILRTPQAVKRLDETIYVNRFINYISKYAPSIYERIGAYESYLKINYYNQSNFTTIQERLDDISNAFMPMFTGKDDLNLEKAQYNTRSRYKLD